MIDRESVLQTTKCNPAQYPQMLADRFPHILEKIISLWSSPEGETYLADLLRPNSGRFDREGFPDEVWNEILHLKVLYDRSRPSA